MRIYVASSWRNKYQNEVVLSLRQDGHEVYDFMDEERFHWSEIDKDWKNWPKNITKYLIGLRHKRAIEGFGRDMSNLRWCDVCIYVMPCGISASLEAGWAKGAGKKLLVYIPELKEPDLMVNMADMVTDDFDLIRTMCLSPSPPSPNSS